MKYGSIKVQRRMRRKRGLTKRVRGTSERPRLTVSRSLKHIYAQVIDDRSGVTICATSTRDRELRGKIPKGSGVEAAKVVGGALAELAKSKNVGAVCFDRNGYKYHGRVKALADAAREGGLSF